MLDVIIKSIVRKLDVHVEEVRDQRVKVERERASGEPRKIATAILKHPEGYATSPREAAESAQKAYAKARSDWERHGIPMLTKLATLSIARERRDETAAVLREHEDTEAIRKATKVHPDFRRLNDAMIAHGVQTGHAATATDGVIAIVSDILQWAGADPNMLDSASPIPAILKIYASRLILTPGQFGDKSRSQPGVPQPQQRYTDPEHYLFNELVPSNSTVTDKVNEGVAGEPLASAQTVESIPRVEPEPPSPSPVQTETPSPLPPPTDGDDAASQAVSAELAQRIAEAVFDKNPFKLGIYWPKGGYPVGDYEPTRLIPALEKAIEVDPWEGWKGFLAAARDGQAREFIAATRQTGIARLAEDLQRGEERALKDARSAGFDV